ncbi:S-adenosyl-L-methionine-dependent methyltransferase [Karstenula rhodostoma CBS 690.94]|uniref:S-adenosyl-L-methionine-dependent methyltransferase n=1 Tax=Karstenula rhodostoma CBS 690.94 TaxID=1392251 RepID=A0A9P4PB92_9PLEO|nr:S-adenosyl-L-methionine-dependent methyltransferase [Karstenula rhodostoma CBS 690.94]
MSSTDKSFLDRVFAAKSKDESRQLYDQWASSYDADMQTYSFIAPRIVAEMVPKYLKVSPADASVVDAGCGSGLVGVTLHKSGFKIIDGLDLSEGMLRVAEKTGAYRNLEVTDLTTKLDIEEDTYDALTCSGTFTHGHVGPEPLPELVRVVKAGGVLVATVLESFWKEGNFEKVLKGLEESGTVELLENNLHNYRKFGGEESGGLVLVLRKL